MHHYIQINIQMVSNIGNKLWDVFRFISQNQMLGTEVVQEKCDILIIFSDACVYLR